MRCPFVLFILFNKKVLLREKEQHRYFLAPKIVFFIKKTKNRERELQQYFSFTIETRGESKKGLFSQTCYRGGGAVAKATKLVTKGRGSCQGYVTGYQGGGAVAKATSLVSTLNYEYDV